ncbi:MAG: hypothetical protein QM785_06210 [Pyrinomonadaceae bacterium]
MSRHLKIIKALILAVSVIAFGCGANDNILRSGKDNTSGRPNSTPFRTSFETDLEAMRTAGFSFIYVLRRKDGGVIDPEDKSVIRVQTTQANRRVSADDGKAIIIGSNFQIAPHNMAAIYQRFAVDNYSPAPDSGTVPLPPENTNVNR